MPAGNFDPVLPIDASGAVSPAGPLVLDDAEVMEKLYAWVFQLNGDGTGAACVAWQDKDDLSQFREAWTTRSDPVIEGRFRPGPAIGLAVAISRVADSPSSPALGTTKVYWWSETIYLTAPEENQGP